jgi:hypothetical protein
MIYFTQFVCENLRCYNLTMELKPMKILDRGEK